MTMRLNQNLGAQQQLIEELSQSVDLEVEAHWQQKISKGIIPIELERSGLPIDIALHNSKMEKLATFEARIVEKLFSGIWKAGTIAQPGAIHYFGVGTGRALAKVVLIANAFQHRVTAYDTCSIGLESALEAFGRQSEPVVHQVFLTDILHVCQKKYIQPKVGTKIILPRVLDILDKQESNWERKSPSDRKMARVLARLGALDPFPSLLLIQRLPEDNPTAQWGDSTPHSLRDILEHLERGAQKKLEARKLDTVEYYDQIHTAILVELKDGAE